jgi:hypothetical protein
MPNAVPFPPGTLHPPLTRVQRLAMIVYLESKGYNDKDIAALIHWPTPGTLKTDYVTAVGSTQGALTDLDTRLIQGYDAAAQGGGFTGQPVTKTQWSLPDWAKPFANLFEFLANPVRVGELIVGVIMVGVAFNAVLRQGTGVGVSVPSTGKLIKSVGKK